MISTFCMIYFCFSWVHEKAVEFDHEVPTLQAKRRLRMSYDVEFSADSDEFWLKFAEEEGKPFQEWWVRTEVALTYVLFVD